MSGEYRNHGVLFDMARSAFEVVSRLLARDQLLARELRSVATGSRQIYREECITADMAAGYNQHGPASSRRSWSSGLGVASNVTKFKTVRPLWEVSREVAGEEEGWSGLVRCLLPHNRTTNSKTNLHESAL